MDATKSTVSIDQLGLTLKLKLPFPHDYLRTEHTLYEAYRTAAISVIQREHGLRWITAYRVVDDAIAAHERLVPGLMLRRIDE